MPPLDMALWTSWLSRFSNVVFPQPGFFDQINKRGVW